MVKAILMDLPSLLLLITLLPLAKASNATQCNGSPLDDVEGGTWVCQPDPTVYGTMCILDCIDPYAIPEGDYEVTCTPDGWFPNPSQVRVQPWAEKERERLFVVLFH